VTFTPVDFDYIAGAGPDAVAEALAFSAGSVPPRGDRVARSGAASLPGTVGKSARKPPFRRCRLVPAAVWLVRATAE
jgi:hypothetical protein